MAYTPTPSTPTCSSPELPSDFDRGRDYCNGHNARDDDSSLMISLGSPYSNPRSRPPTPLKPKVISRATSVSLAQQSDELAIPRPSETPAKPIPTQHKADPSPARGHLHLIPTTLCARGSSTITLDPREVSPLPTSLRTPSMAGFPQAHVLLWCDVMASISGWPTLMFGYSTTPSRSQVISQHSSSEYSKTYSARQASPN